MTRSRNIGRADVRQKRFFAAVTCKTFWAKESKINFDFGKLNESELIKKRTTHSHFGQLTSVRPDAELKLVIVDERPLPFRPVVLLLPQ